MEGRQIKINDRYLIGKKLGEGSFGQVFCGTDLLTGEIIAIKLAPFAQSRNLQLEAQIYQLLNSDHERSFGVPNLYWAGVHQDYFILVMNCLNKSLNCLKETSINKRFSLKTICLIALQGLYLLEYVHSFDIIHRDMKPDNFMMGKGKYQDRLYLIDFGLAKYYRCQKTGKHLEYQIGKNLTGTAKYVSINTHLGCEQSRRDDLESFGYVLIHLAKGKLPWNGIRYSNKQKRNKIIGEIKIATSLKELCQDLPKEFILYFQYCRNLEFDQNPDYKYLRSLFLDIVDHYNFKVDGQYDWSFTTI